MHDDDRPDDQRTPAEASSGGEELGKNDAEQDRRKREESHPPSTLRGAPDRADTMKDKLEQAASEGYRSEADETGPGKSYETWTKKQLYQRARELRIANRSLMTKRRLIEALRRHE
jgi:hypothetical protein